MGRPLKSVYFGNRSTGNIGGEGVATISVSGTNNNYTSKPGLTLSASHLPGGTLATAAVATMKGVSAQPATTGTGGTYAIADVLTPTGVTGTAPTFTVSELTARSVALVAGQGGTDYVADNLITFTGAGWSQNLILKVLTVNAGAVETFEVTLAGKRTANIANPITGGVVTAGSQQTGAGAQFNVLWGAAAVTLTTAGAASVIPANPAATTVAPSGGTGATLNIAYGVNAVTVTDPGSGYTSTSITVTDDPDGNATFTPTLTSTNTNSFSVLAWVPAADGGTQALAADIVSQHSARSFRVTTSEGTGFCRLTGNASLAVGEMRFTALDSLSNEYYITKISGRKATLTQKAGGSNYEWATGDDAPWTLDAAEANVKVQIVSV